MNYIYSIQTLASVCVTDLRLTWHPITKVTPEGRLG